MEFGMPTLLELDTLEKNAELANKLGLDFVEINMNFKQYQVEALRDTDKLNKLKQQYGIYFTIHLDENFNPCEYNTRVADAWFETLKETVHIASMIEAPIINMHMHRGIYITLPDEKVFLYDRNEKEYVERMKQLKSYCEESMNASKMKLCIENTEGYFDVQKKVLLDLLESEAIRLTWDIGHSFVADRVDEPFLLEHKDKIAHFHIHDAKGKKNHLALGDGVLTLDDKFEIASKNQDRMVLETKTVQALTDSVAYLSDRKLFSNPLSIK